MSESKLRDLLAELVADVDAPSMAQQAWRAGQRSRRRSAVAATSAPGQPGGDRTAPGGCGDRHHGRRPRRPAGAPRPDHKTDEQTVLLRDGGHVLAWRLTSGAVYRVARLPGSTSQGADPGYDIAIALAPQ